MKHKLLKLSRWSFVLALGIFLFSYFLFHYTVPGDASTLIPVDPGVEYVGCSSDHLIMDVTDSGRIWKSGDTMSFKVRYGNMLCAFTGRHIHIKYCYDA